MFDSDKMLKPRQDTAAEPIGSPTFGPGPVNPSIPPPGLPVPFSPAPPPPGVTVTTLTFSSATVTVTLGSNPIPSSDTTFMTSSVLTSPPPTSTTPAPSPTQSSPAQPASFSILTPNNATTCTPLQIDWKVSNPSSVDLSSSRIDLAVTSVGNGNVNMTIASGQPVQSEPYGWSSVSVPPGQYSITGRWADGQGATVQSPVFTVLSGSNTTCLASAGTTPISTASKTNKGAIAGGTIGGISLLACVGIGFFFLCGLRSRAGKRRSGLRRGWGGLGSLDGKEPLPRGVNPGDSNDYLRNGAAATAGRDAPDPVGVRSSSSLDTEKMTPLSTPPHASALDRGAPWAAPTMELAQLSSRQNTQDSPRSSLEFPSDLFTTPTSRRASRTPRKPVPAYEPTREELASMAMARTRSDQSQARSSISDSPHQPSSSLSTSSMSHPSPGVAPELRSKSSGLFEGQPVHYLIPDMPPQPPA